MSVDVVLGDAFRFTSFDQKSNTFRVRSDLMKAEDVGDYPIQVTARFFNSTFDETFKRTFILTVWDDVAEPVEPWFPTDPIIYQEWNNGDVVRQNTTQEYDPERPIPYIVDLQYDGLLIIGWDREMQQPENFTEIPPTKIAVEEVIDIE